MRRLYFLLPDIKTARMIVTELLLTHVEERHIHIIAKEDTSLEELPEASLLQKSDFIPATEKGIALGGTTGLLAGLVAMSVPGVVIAGGAILLLSSLAGAGMGAWLGGMIGLDVSNTRHKQFADAINKGSVLMLVDIPKTRVDEISELVKKHHPEADFGGTEPDIPAFP